MNLVQEFFNLIDGSGTLYSTYTKSIKVSSPDILHETAVKFLWDHRNEMTWEQFSECCEALQSEAHNVLSR